MYLVQQQQQQLKQSANKAKQIICTIMKTLATMPPDTKTQFQRHTGSDGWFKVAIYMRF